jgi:hypothetical protein
VDATTRPAVVRWRAGGTRGESTLVYGAPLRLALPADARELALENGSRGVDLVLRSAHVLGEERAAWPSFLLAGLLLGLVGACLAPAAVLVSRFTSAATATALPLVLVLAGGLRPIVEAVARVGASGAEAFGVTVLRAALVVVPDLAPLAVLGEPAAGRALAVADLAAALPFLPYGLVALLLVTVPVPGHREDRA